MNRLRIEIDRLQIALDGFPPEVAEEAVAGLDRELRFRLMRTRLADFPSVTVPIQELQITDISTGIDGAALRAILAERLVDEIMRFANADNSGVA